MPSSGRLYIGRKVVKELQHIVEVHRIFLDDFHWLELFQSGLFYESVIIHIAIIGQVPGIGYIPYIANLISEVSKRTVDKIKGHKSTHIAHMHIRIDRRPTDIHTDIPFQNGFKDFLFSA